MVKSYSIKWSSMLTVGYSVKIKMMLDLYNLFL